jgi:hypothetical protein
MATFTAAPRKTAKRATARVVVATKTPATKTATTATKTNLDSVFVSGVARLLRNKASTWTGSMTELEASLRKVVRRQNVSWPSNPRAMRATVDRLLPDLKKAGVKVRFGRTNDHNRKRFVEFGR